MMIHLEWMKDLKVYNYINSILKLSLCNYSDAYILLKRSITVFRWRADDAARVGDRNNKQAISKNSAPRTNCLNEINNS